MQENFKCVHQVSNAEKNLMNLFIKIDYKIKSFSFSFYWPSIFVPKYCISHWKHCWCISFCFMMGDQIFEITRWWTVQCILFSELFHDLFSFTQRLLFNYVFCNHSIFCAGCSQIVGILDFLHLVCRWRSCICLQWKD